MYSKILIIFKTFYFNHGYPICFEKKKKKTANNYFTENCFFAYLLYRISFLQYLKIYGVIGLSKMTRFVYHEKFIKLLNFRASL